MDTSQEIKRFLACFKRGEQVFVGFRGGSTHGYVSSITDEGFGIVQLNKPKEYIYDWQHFEFVASPGFRVKRLTEFEAVNMFSVVLKGGNPLPDDVKPSSLVLKAGEDLLIDNPCKFKSSELRLTRTTNAIRIGIKVRTGSDEFSNEAWLTDYSLRYDQERRYCAPPKDGEIMWLGAEWVYGSNLEANKGRLRCQVQVNGARDLERLRAGEKLEWFDPIELARSFGDPWLCEDPAAYLGHRVWQSNDGYLLGNRHGDLYLGEKKNAN